MSLDINSFMSGIRLWKCKTEWRTSDYWIHRLAGRILSFKAVITWGWIQLNQPRYAFRLTVRLPSSLLILMLPSSLFLQLHHHSKMQVPAPIHMRVCLYVHFLYRGAELENFHWWAEFTFKSLTWSKLKCVYISSILFVLKKCESAPSLYYGLPVSAESDRAANWTLDLLELKWWDRQNWTLGCILWVP